MNSYEIYRQAIGLIRKYSENDPLKLARDMGIMVYDVPDLSELLGMYTFNWNHGIILMNPGVNETLYRMVLAHEIGHHCLHRPLLAAGVKLQEFELFNMTNMTEYEANAFAAHILIDDNEMEECFREGCDIADAAKRLCVNVNLLLIKLRELNRMGRDIKLPYEPDARFFRNTKY